MPIAVEINSMLLFADHLKVEGSESRVISLRGVHLLVRRWSRKIPSWVSLDSSSLIKLVTKLRNMLTDLRFTMRSMQREQDPQLGIPSTPDHNHILNPNIDSIPLIKMLHFHLIEGKELSEGDQICNIWSTFTLVDEIG